MAGRTIIKDPEVDHPVSEETDEVSKGSQVSKSSQTNQSYALDKARDYVERPQSLAKTSGEPLEVPTETEGPTSVPGLLSGSRSVKEDGLSRPRHVVG